MQLRFLLGKVSFFFVTIQFICLGVIGHFTPLHNIDVEASISTFCHRHKNSLSVSGVEDILLMTSTLHTDEVQFCCCCLLLLLLLEPLSIKGRWFMPPSLPFPSSVFSLKFCFSTIISTVLVHCKIVMVSLCSVLCQSPCWRRKIFLWFFLNVISWQTDCSSPRTQI